MTEEKTINPKSYVRSTFAKKAIAPQAIFADAIDHLFQSTSLGDARVLRPGDLSLAGSQWRYDPLGRKTRLSGQSFENGDLLLPVFTINSTFEAFTGAASSPSWRWWRGGRRNGVSRVPQNNVESHPVAP
jgi:hypothetical protein